jgi:glycosyltransferase involved in cell wall biosynthesis
MTAPFFSIVIPTFNRSDLFPYAVQSILRQTFRDFEIIVSDNCSADDTPRVAQQFVGRRVRYVRTPRHFVIADAWEFARRQASGSMIMMLSDDDALLADALERFNFESRSCGADFLFCSRGEYRDFSYPGPGRNSMDCPPFSGASRVIAAEEFIRPLFLFRQKFDMHPSAFVFAKDIADRVAARTGRFFWTNGVEYSAWPIAAVFAKQILYIDTPLVVLGRTGKSWGTNIALCNPGKEHIDALIKDVDHKRNYAPLNNFTMCNLMAEGMLTAKSLFPNEFQAYEFDESQYLRRSMIELRQRDLLGVDVSREIGELVSYAAKYPLVAEELKTKPFRRRSRLAHRVHAVLADLGGRTLRQRVSRYQRACGLPRGSVRSGFSAAGEDFGFCNILGCTDFLARTINKAAGGAMMPNLEAAKMIANSPTPTQPFV